MKIAPTKTLSQIAPGDALDPLERTITVAATVAYGGATWDWHPGHFDPGYAKEVGLPGPFVDGQMFGALLAKQLVDTFGPRARVRKMAFRFRSMVFPNQEIRCIGKITAVTSTEEGVVVEVAQQIHSGDQRVIDQATAEVLLPT
jgi:acyl dehydratase